MGLRQGYEIRGERFYHAYYAYKFTAIKVLATVCFRPEPDVQYRNYTRSFLTKKSTKEVSLGANCRSLG